LGRYINKKFNRRRSNWRFSKLGIRF